MQVGVELPRLRPDKTTHKRSWSNMINCTSPSLDSPSLTRANSSAGTSGHFCSLYSCAHALPSIGAINLTKLLRYPRFSHHPVPENKTRPGRSIFISLTPENALHVPKNMKFLSIHTMLSTTIIYV